MELTSRLLVECFNLGIPGSLLMSVKATGPVELTDAEVAQVLRKAADVAENHRVQRQEEETGE